MSRRGNGFEAGAYRFVADVEPHLVDEVLSRLALQRIAAFAVVAGGVRGPYGDVTIPRELTEQVHADADRFDEAASVVRRYVQEVREEVAWEGIVAGFDGSATAVPAGGTPWPAAEDLPPPGARAAGGPGAAFTADPDAAQDAGPDDDAGTGRAARERAGAVADDEHFVPPPPPPLPRTDTLGRLAWSGLLGAPVLLLVAAVLGLDVGGWVGVLTLTAFVAGFVTLVARMKDRPPDDTDPDNGAVV